MKIINGVLSDVQESDIINGVFDNKKVIEIADNCFNNLISLKEIKLINVIKVGSDCISSNENLTQLTLPKATTFGSDCISYNENLTQLTLPKATTFGSDCISSNENLTVFELNNKKHNVKTFDGIMMIIESEKTSKGIKTYSGENFISMNKKVIKTEKSFVASKDNFNAHGLTLKQAIKDLHFKLISEQLKKEPITKDTIITMDYYRIVTGACEMGCKSWIEQNKITKTEYKASELLPLLEKTGAYGVDKFKQLINF